MKAFISRLINNADLTRVEFRSESDDEMQKMAEVIKDCPTITKIKMSGRWVGLSCGKAVCDLVATRDLQEVEIEYIRCSVDDVKSVASNTSMTRLSLDHCWLKDEEIIVLCGALKKHPKLSDLSLNWIGTRALFGGGLGYKGLDAVADLIRHNTVITKINLTYNQIDNDQACTLAAAIKDSMSLKSVDLSRNDLRQRGADCLFDALKHSKSMEELVFADVEVFRPSGVVRKRDLD